MKRMRAFIACAAVLYVILGMLIPFMFHPKVSGEFSQKFDESRFYGDGTESADRAAVVETSTEALDIRLKMFEEAKERIVLSTFDIRPGGSCTDIFSSLLDAADRGVRVQVLVDGLYGTLHMLSNPMFYACGSHPNFEIRFYNVPSLLMPWTIHGRLHDKYILIDDKLLLLGGRNTFDYFLGDYTDKNLSFDREVLIYNTAAGTAGSGESVINDVYSYFEELWESRYNRTVYNTKGLNPGKTRKAADNLREHYGRMYEKKGASFFLADYRAMTVPVEKVTFLSNPTHIYAKQPLVFWQLTQLMKQAETRIYIQTPYVAFSRDMYEEFREISRNPVLFEMQINSVAVGDNFMASSDYIHNKQKLLNTGVQVYEFQGEHSSHGKSGLIDDRLSFVGSYNFDMRSTYLDTETVLVIDGKEFNEQLEGHIMKMHEQSLPVLRSGSYEEKKGVEAKEVKPVKKVIFSITSRLFQLFRYLI